MGEKLFALLDSVFITIFFAKDFRVRLLLKSVLGSVPFTLAKVEVLDPYPLLVTQGDSAKWDWNF